MLGLGRIVVFTPKTHPQVAIGDALQLSLVDEEVVFLGGRVGFSMTRRAAAETSVRLAKLLNEAAASPATGP